MCCAYCGEFLRYSGFQCEDCKFLCHKKCYTNVVTKCIAKVSTETDPDEAKLNHRIPHRFEPTSNRGTKWCCHCGYILPWGKHKVRKCSECGIMCHAQCAHLVPDFCGMSMEMANQILKTIQDAQRTQEKKKRLSASEAASTGHSPRRYGKKNIGRLQEAHETFPTAPVATNKYTPVSAEVTKQQSPQKTEVEEEKPAYGNQVVATDRLNAFIDNNEAYLNFTESVKTDVSSELDTSSRTLDPTFKYPTNSTEEELNDTSEVRDDRMQWELENEQANAGYIRKEEFMSKQALELNTRRSHSEEEPTDTNMGITQIPILETDSRDADMTIDTQHSNPFRDMDTERFLHEQEVSKEIIQTPNAITTVESGIAKEVSPQKSQHSKHKKRNSKRRKVSLDNFILLKVLGKGNFGKVILSRSKNTGRLCAIKVLKKDNIIQNHDIESARAEKKVFLLATKTKHPFLTNLYCSFQTENRIYFAMEFIGGGDLMWHVQNQRLSVRRAKFYAAEVLLALKYFHDNGVIYRDLKLENILLTPQGHIKIADYGLCKDEMWYNNKTSTFCGTPEFMAPEILKEQGYTRAVDWWAFGVLLYQMLLCQSPFSGDDEDEVFNAILTDEPLYPIDMAGDIVQIFQGLLTKDPENRLGAGQRDALEVMEEPFFRNINFEDILNLRVQPPYVPEIKSPEDTSYFEHEFTSAPPTLTPLPSILTTTQQEEFRGFSFMPDDLEL